MENIHKIFELLKKLEFDKKKDEKYISSNLEIIKKFLNFELNELQQTEILKVLNIPQAVGPPEPLDRNILEYLHYVFSLMYCCLTIKNYTNIDSTNKKDLISVHNLELLTKTLQEISNSSIRLNLPIIFQQHIIFKNLEQLKITANMNLLDPALRFNLEILQMSILFNENALNTFILDTMAAAFTLLSFTSKNVLKPDDIPISKEILNYIWNHTRKHVYFRNLLILKGVQYKPLQIYIHKDLLQKLQDHNGFTYLVDAIVGNLSGNVPNWKCYEVIANIVSHKEHKNEFYDNIIEQVFKFLYKSILNKNLHGFIPVGVISLKRLYEINEKINNRIKKEIENLFKVLIQPSDLLAGVILMENNEIVNLFDLLKFMFCASNLNSLPSELLIDYLPILLGIYQIFPTVHPSYQNITNLIIYCLSNRNDAELKRIFQFLIIDSHLGELKYLHQRATFIFNEKCLTVNAQVAAEELIHKNNNFTVSLSSVLKKSNNNPLIYKSFVCTLKLLETFASDDSKADQIDLLQEEEELDEFLSKKFSTRFSVINMLKDIIEFRPFHSQFCENSNEILEFIQNLLLRRINNCLGSDDTISISLAIFQEVVESKRDHEEFTKYVELLKKYSAVNKNEAVKIQLSNLLDLLEGRSFEYNTLEPSKFVLARKLIEETQPHLRVYGIEQIIKLIRDKDEEILANKHSVLALGLHAVKDEESYTFLNCVRLFVALVNILEAEVFETLLAEYLNQNESIDYRLKIGETILKVIETLGPLSFKYRNILLNCFVNGCKDPKDEFRFSSLSNLGTLCRLLTYQVHSWFQELLQIISSIIQIEKYLPARRAAVLILNQLLFGVENLTDFEQYLLPVYRLLKFIAESDSDQVTRVHATNSLKTLSDKCKKFLIPELKMEQEIKILGINDNKKKKSCSILEIN